MAMKHVFAYDLECLKNFFSAKFANIEDESDRYTFIISSEQNDSMPLIQFISQPNLRLVSYNGHRYDDVLLNAFLMKGGELDNKKLYRISKTIIDVDWKEHPAWLKKLKYFDKPFESIDLLKLVTVNKARPSLKSCGIHLKYPRIQDFNFDPHKPISADDIITLLDYQEDDVNMTWLLYKVIVSDIDLRNDMSKRYDIHIVSAGDSEITNKLLQKFYGDFPPVPEPPKFLCVKDLWPKNLILLTEPLLNLQKELFGLKVYYPKYSFGNKEVTIGNTTYNFGVGGLHSKEKARKFETTDSQTIKESDVTSYYVNFMKYQDIFPVHLGPKTITILDMLLLEREAGKAENDPVRRDGLKIPVLNFFGKMNFPPSQLYDPKAFFRVTIGGQIALLDLIEKLELAGIAVISGNTDGIVCKIPRQLENKHLQVCQEWQDRYSLKLEHGTYKLYVQRHVNDYMVLKEGGGKPKVKGATFVDRLSLTKRDFVYAFNAPVTALAIQAYFKDGIDPEQTINNETDIYNFMYSQTQKRGYNLIAQSIKNGILVKRKLQKTNRWLVSQSGERLTKIHRDGREWAVMKDCSVKIANDVKDVSFADIDKQYYISEIKKVIAEIEGEKISQMSLF